MYVYMGDLIVIFDLVVCRDCNSGTLCQSWDPEIFTSGIPGSQDPSLVRNASKIDCVMEDFAILSLI